MNDIVWDQREAVLEVEGLIVDQWDATDKRSTESGCGTRTGERDVRARWNELVQLTGEDVRGDGVGCDGYRILHRRHFQILQKVKHPGEPTPGQLP